MGLNKNGRQEVEKQAKEKNYSWSSDGSKMTNGSGGTVRFSESGGSVSINGSKYNSSSDTKGSTKWRG
ncbi:MAG TPA: hypothetical protein VL098_08420 [Flavipsychrobacter sp.]|nr:hypothetical protein [Flavipsychrobacter sp.]